MIKPIEGAKKILKTGLGVKDNETVLIIAEKSTAKDALFFMESAKEIKINVSMLVIPNLKFNGEEPAEYIAKIMQLPNAVIAATNHSISTTSARVQACKAGVRFISIPTFTRNTLCKGCIEADFLKIKPTVWKVAERLTQAQIVKITSESGTNLTFSVAGRHGNAVDFICHEPNCYRSMSVESCIAPVEDSATGTLIVDVAAPSKLGCKGIIKFDIEKGTIKKISGGVNAKPFRQILDKIGDPNIYRIAEFGIGLNPAVKLTGMNYIEDESALGTAHIGIGRNVSIGGKIQAKGHFDLIFKSPSVFLDNSLLMDKGNLKL